MRFEDIEVGKQYRIINGNCPRGLKDTTVTITKKDDREYSIGIDHPLYDSVTWWLYPNDLVSISNIPPLKAGDIVHVRKDLIEDTRYGHDTFIKEMECYKDKMVSITYVANNGDKYKIGEITKYKIEKPSLYYFTAEMFDIPKFRVGDVVTIQVPENTYVIKDVYWESDEFRYSLRLLEGDPNKEANVPEGLLISLLYENHDNTLKEDEVTPIKKQETMKINYKEKKILSNEEVSSQNVELAVETTKLAIEAKLLEAKKSVVEKTTQLEEAKTEYPINTGTIVTLTNDVEYYNKCIKTLTDLKKEYGF